MLIVKGGPPQKIGKAQSVHTFQESNLIKLNPIQTLKTEGCFDNFLSQLYNSVEENERISGRVFKQLLIFIDNKFSELSGKFDNYDNLSDINTHLLKIQSSQVSPIANKKNEESPNGIIRHKSSGSLLYQDNSSISEKGKTSPGRRDTQQKSGFAGDNRMNIFERKIRQCEERQVKFEQDQQDKYSGFSNKLEKTIRSIQDKQQSLQNNDAFKNLTEFSENQKQLLSYVQSFQQEIIDVNKKILSVSKEFQEQINFIKISLEHSTSVSQGNATKYEQISTSIQQIDQDLLTILKCYKDVLNEIFRIEILEQQQKRVFKLLTDL